MKEIGEYLKQERRKNGVSISEACEDLNLNQQLIEAIEEGNSKAFRDVFELKETIQSYAKYLGLNVDEVLDRFNDFIFEKTSRISLEDIKNAKTDSEKSNRIASPYTKIKHTRYDIAPVVLLIAVLLFVSLIVYIVLRVSHDESNVSYELSSLGGLKYEFTK